MSDGLLPNMAGDRERVLRAKSERISELESQVTALTEERDYYEERYSGWKLIEKTSQMAFKKNKELVKQLSASPWKKVKDHLIPDGNVLVIDNKDTMLLCVAPCGLLKGTTDGSGEPWFGVLWALPPPPPITSTEDES